MKSTIEWYIIQEVKKRRLEANMSQQYLGDCINISQSYIRDIENPNNDAAYNVDHINEIAKVFRISPRDLWPEKPL